VKVKAYHSTGASTNVRVQLVFGPSVSILIHQGSEEGKQHKAESWTRRGCENLARRHQRAKERFLSCCTHWSLSLVLHFSLSSAEVGCNAIRPGIILLQNLPAVKPDRRLKPNFPSPRSICQSEARIVIYCIPLQKPCHLSFVLAKVGNTNDARCTSLL
jgi:hypothetical protein